MAKSDIKGDANRRLKRIAGQVQGLMRMIDAERHCPDILTQAMAVEAAIHSLAQLLARNYLEATVQETFKQRNTKERQAKIDELMRTFSTLRPR
jgi:DNA-binding FrmR family transcriptional regulator